MNSTKEDNSIKTIDILSASDTIIYNLSYLASDIEYVPVRTREKIHFNSIFKIVSCSNKIYINTGNDLICIDKKGNLLYSLSLSNLEQEEPLDFIFDFDLSSDAKTLVVLSYDRIFIYNDTGNEFVFQKSIILKRPWPSAIDMVPGTTNMLISLKSIGRSAPSLFLLIDENGDTLFYRKQWTSLKRSDRIDEDIIHYKTNDRVCFKEPFNDTVFYVNKDSNDFRSWIIIDSKGKTYPHLVKRDGVFVDRELNEYSFLNWIYEVPGYIGYNYSFIYLNVPNPVTNSPYIISKSILLSQVTNKKAEIPENAGLKDDLSGGPDFLVLCVSQGKLYSSVFAPSLKRHTQSESFLNAVAKYPLKKRELKMMGDTLSEEDNPVLIIVTPKSLDSVSDLSNI